MTQYYSSAQKDVVRSHFDQPLVTSIFERKGRALRYFGLPGAEAMDIAAWAPMLDFVSAVDFDLGKLLVLEKQLDTRYPEIRYRTHLGDADQVILKNGSWRPGRPRGTWQHAAMREHPEAGFIWDFDIVYLDYFGKFLPYERGSAKVQNRTRAIRHLFATDRQDAWQPWLLLITVEARLFGEEDKNHMRSFLRSCTEGASSELSRVLEFLTQEGLEANHEAARLVHGTAAYLVAMAASNAVVRVIPRGTVLYSGANNTPMLHLAYEILPTGELIARQVQPLPLLRCPILQVKNPVGDPWFELSQHQPEAQTPEEVKAYLEFLPSIEGIVANTG